MESKNDLVAGVSAAMQQRIQELRRKVDALPVSPRDRRKLGVTLDLKRELVECHRQCGLAVAAFTSAVGISKSAFGRWQSGPAGKKMRGRSGGPAIEIAKSAFQKVRIGEEATAEGKIKSPRDGSAGLVLETPTGHRIRGLDIDGLSQLLRSLC